MRVLIIWFLCVGAAAAERIGIVVAGEPSKQVSVIEGLHEALRLRGDIADASVFPADASAQVAACFLAGDPACATPLVAAAGTRALLVMVEVERRDAGDAVTLTGWLVATNSTRTATRDCAACSATQVAAEAGELARTLLATTASVSIQTTPTGATVRVDGVTAGRSPTTIEAQPGTRVIEAEWGSRRRRQTITAEAGQALAISLTRPEAPGHSALTWGLVAGGAAVLATGGVLILLDEDAAPVGSPHQPLYRDSATLGVAAAAVGAASLGYGLWRWRRESRHIVVGWGERHGAGVVIAGSF